MATLGLDHSFIEHGSEFSSHEPHRCAATGRAPEDLAAQVYRHVLGDGPVSISEVSRRVGCSRVDASEAIMTLHELRLVRHPGQDDDRFQAVCPEVAQAEVLLPLEDAIARQRHQLSRLRQRLSPLIEAFDDHRLRGETQSVIVSETATEVRLRLRAAVREAKRRVYVIDPPDREDFFGGFVGDAVLPLLGDALGRGVDVRVLCGHSARTDARTRETAAAVQARGGRYRSVANPYTAMIVVDREKVFVPGTPSDQDPVGRAVLCRDPTLADLFSATFDRLWSSATDLRPEVSAYGHTLDDLRRTILQLLAAGLTDDALARRLGLSPRTCRRHIAAIMDELQVSSRFQAGVVASLHGLLPVDDAAPAASGSPVSGGGPVE